VYNIVSIGRASVFLMPCFKTFCCSLWPLATRYVQTMMCLSVDHKVIFSVLECISMVPDIS